MRLLIASLVLIGALSFSGCIVVSSQPVSARWTSGFWFWEGSSIDPSYSGEALDVLFVQVGTISKETIPALLRATGNPADPWRTYGALPRELPAAREYWLVFRYVNRGVPDTEVAAKLDAEIERLQGDARERHLNVAGVQLDIDSPTPALARYADFIGHVRQGLPKEMQVSITALLDWFRDGTDISDVIAQVDEFVPQFYDLGDPTSAGEAVIAARIDAARWGPVLNRFHKRFRIGISSFGRARLISNASSGLNSYLGSIVFGDLRPLDVATNPAFQLQTSRSEAGETVLSYRATRRVQAGYARLEADDMIQFIVSTPDAIRAAVQSARQIKGYMVGVVFFRWPSSREDWAMQPDEVLDAAGLSAPGRRRASGVQMVGGDCAAVHCVDVYLESAKPLSAQPVRYRIRSSTPLDYFLPERNMPVHMTGTSEMEVTLPPYCGRGHLYIGRAVSLQHAEFTVEAEP